MISSRMTAGVGRLWRSVAVVSFAAATVLMSGGSASAQAPSPSQSTSMQKAALVAATASPATAPGAVPQAPIDGCPFEWFCAYPGTNFGGTPIKMFDCGVDVFIPFVGNGSWINNQTSGTRARFKDANHNIIATTSGAFSADTSQNWSPVFYAQAC